MHRVTPVEKSVVDKNSITEKYHNRDKVLTPENIALALGIKQKNIRADRSLILINFDNEMDATNCKKKLVGSRNDLDGHGGYYLQTNNNVYGLMHHNQLSIGNKALDHFKEVIQKKLKEIAQKKLISVERKSVEIQGSSRFSTSEKTSLFIDDIEEMLALEMRQDEAPASSQSSSGYTQFAGKQGINLDKNASPHSSNGEASSSQSASDHSKYDDKINSLIARLEREIKKRIGVQEFIKFCTHLNADFHVKRKQEKLEFLRAVLDHYRQQPEKDMKASIDVVRNNNPEKFHIAMKGFFSRTRTLVTELEQANNEDKQTIAARC